MSDTQDTSLSAIAFRRALTEPFDGRAGSMGKGKRRRGDATRVGKTGSEWHGLALAAVTAITPLPGRLSTHEAGKHQSDQSNLDVSSSGS